MKTESKKIQSIEALTNLSVVRENETYQIGAFQLAKDSDSSEKMTDNAGENIFHPVRRAKAIGAYGTFTVTNDISKYTRANIFSQIGKQTRLFSRFSILEDGGSCREHDPKEFALKFFTQDGEWDIAGNNTPVLFTGDIKKYNDFLKIQKRDPRTNLKNPTQTWDFFSKNPESLHRVMMLMSDRGSPCGYSYMDGFGVHAFSMVNSKDEKVWVKFHFKTMQGIKTFTEEEACLRRGEDTDYAQRDLVNAIDKKDFPKWTMSIQVMSDAEAKELDFDPFDVTKIWSKNKFPLIEAGVIELNKIPENFLKEVEQAEFTEGNIIDGISYSPDKMLLSKLENDSEIPGYQPIELIEAMLAFNHRSDSLKKSRTEQLNYFTSYSGNLYTNNTEHTTRLKDKVIDLSKSKYLDGTNENDHYSQAGVLFRKVMLETEQANLIGNIIASMSRINGPNSKQIISRLLSHWYSVDEQLGLSIANGLGVNSKAPLTT